MAAGTTTRVAAAAVGITSPGLITVVAGQESGREVVVEADLQKEREVGRQKEREVARGSMREVAARGSVAVQAENGRDEELSTNSEEKNH